MRDIHTNRQDRDIGDPYRAFKKRGQPGTPFSPDRIAEKYWSVVQPDGAWQSEVRFDGT
jgi:hypothetical protein